MTSLLALIMWYLAMTLLAAAVLGVVLWRRRARKPAPRPASAAREEP